MILEPGNRVTVSDKQLHGNNSLLVDGQIIAISGSTATVQLDGEEFPRSFTTDQLSSSEEVYGAELTSQFDHQVINAIRR